MTRVKAGWLTAIVLLALAGCAQQHEPRGPNSESLTSELFLAPAVVETGGSGDAKLLWGFVDGLGRERIPARYEDAFPFSEGLAAVRVNGKWGFMDADGKMIIKPAYRNVYSFSEGRAAVQLENRRCGFIDASGRLVIPALYAGVTSFSEGLAGVSESGSHWALTSVYIDTAGRIATASGFMNFHRFNSGRAIVRDHGGAHARVIDRTGQVAFTEEEKNRKIDRISVEYSDGLLAYQDANAKWGFLDIQGNPAIKADYDDVTAMHEGFASVRKGEVWGVIDRKGVVVLPIRFRGREKAAGAHEVTHWLIGRMNSRRAADTGPSSMFTDWLYDEWVPEGGVDEATGAPLLRCGLAFVVARDWSGYVNVRGERVIDAAPGCEYGDFDRGLAQVYCLRGGSESKRLFFQYIDTRGRVIFERDVSKAFQ